MPTKSSLHLWWEAKIEFGLTAAQGHGPEHADHIPLPPPRKVTKGEVLGRAIYNPVRDDFRLDPTKNDTTTSPKPE